MTITTNISTLLGNGEAAEDGELLDTLRTIAKNMRERHGRRPRSARQHRSARRSTANIETLSQLQASRRKRDRSAADGADPQRRPADSDHGALANLDDTNIAAASIAYANEQAAYEAALRAGATIVQESLLNFLQ